MKAPQQPENAPDRSMLTAKEASLIAIKAMPNDENAVAPRAKKALGPTLTIPDDREAKIALPVFTPVASTDNRPSALARKEEQHAPAPAPAPAPARFVPFVDADAQPPPLLPNIFARAPANANENGHDRLKPRPLGQKPTFTPFVDAEPPRVVLGEREPLTSPLQAQLTPSTSTDEDDFGDQDVNMEQGQEQEPEQEQEYYDDFESTDQSSSDFDDGQAAVEVHTPVHSDAGDDDDRAFDDEYEEEYEDGGAGYHAPMGGRLGQFNVMTPITERTFEYTHTHTTAANMSARATPSERAFSAAKESADMLAAELADEEFDDDDGEVGPVEERTGTLSLTDALTAVSSFKPPNPCNPFNAPIVSALLSFIPADPEFRDLRAQESNQLDGLQKFAKKKGRRSGSGAGAAPQDSMRVNLNGRQYDVLAKLGEGGFGAVFVAVDLAAAAAKRRDDFDEDEDEYEDEDEIPKVALKVVKPRNLWEFHILRRIHLTVPARLKRSIIMPETLYAYRDESFLVLDFCKQGTLLDVVNNAPHAGITQQGACLDELLVMFFTVELLRLLEGLHRAGFIHGDVKIDNCLLRLEDVPGGSSAWMTMYDPSGDGGWGCKGIKMIDFGRTVDTRLFPAGQRFTGDWDPDARDCLEMREGKPWTYQTDYFGLAGIIYCMLYGKYIETSSITPVPNGDGPMRYKLATPFKRYWQGDLWTRLFDVLLNSALVRPEGQLPLCDDIAVLREEMEKWLQANCSRASNSLKGLLKKVEVMTTGGKDGR